MNCKPGDLAVIVRASPMVPHALGLFVTIEEAADPGHYSHWLKLEGPQPVWWCRFSRPVASWKGEVSDRFKVPDACLRPIRPGESDDEVDAWASKPADLNTEVPA